MTQSRQCLEQMRNGDRAERLLVNEKKGYSFFTTMLNKCCKIFEV